MDELTATAWRLLDTLCAKRKPYAVFFKRVVEWMPADGPRFAALQQNPQRMAFFVGVFDQNVRLTELVDALRAMGEPCS